jgi:putative transposase
MLYHVIARGNDKQCIFVDERDCRSFLALLAESVARFNVNCLAYCLMWNHYHLLLKVGVHPLARAMQHLNSTYCQGFNRRHGRVGHLLQGRYKSPLVEDGATARAVLRYIAMNPVRAQYVDDPKDWAWGSYGFAVSAADPPEYLALADVWAAFGTTDPEVGRLRLTEFVRAGLQDDTSNALLRGSEKLAQRVAPLLEPFQPTLEYARRERYAARPPLNALFEGCCGRKELENAAHRAFCEHAYTLAEIGQAVSRHPSAVCRWIRRARRRHGHVLPSSEDKRATIKI